MKTRRQYDQEFKKMAVELANAKGSLKVAAEEVDISPQILTRWRREREPSQAFRVGSETQENREQQEILLLKKQLKQAELEGDILKKAVSMRCPASSPGAEALW